MILAVLRSMRPRQWTKNLLVVAAPLAAGELFHAPVWWQTLVAFVAFCLVSGAVYLVNDAVDVESDRAHPRKRQRPIAAGELPRAGRGRRRRRPRLRSPSAIGTAVDLAARRARW